MLRNEIWRVFRRACPESMGVPDVLTLDEAINLTLDRVIVETVKTYEE